MDSDRLDKFMKDKVFDHKTPVDSDLLWEQIQAKQNEEEKPKRRFLIFWLFGGVLLLAGILVGYSALFKPEVKKEMAKSTIQHSKNDSDTETNAITKTQKETEKENNINENDAKKSGIVVDKNSKSTLDLKTIEKPNNNDIEHSNFKQKSTSATDYGLPLKNTSDTDTESNTDTNTKTNSRIETQKINYSEQIASHIILQKNEIDRQENDFVFLQNTKEENVKNKVTSEETVVSNTDFNKDKNTTSPTPFSKEKAKKNSLLLLPSLSSSLDLLNFATSADKKHFSITSQEGDNNKTSNTNKLQPTSPLSIGGHISYGLGASKLRAKSTDSLQYVNIRKDSETARQVISAGLDFQWQHKSGWFGKTGLHYEQINEQLDYNKIDTSLIFQQDAVHTLYYRSDGSITEDSLGAYALTRRSLKKVIYNRYRSIDIPLLVGYAPISNKRWNWFIEGGILVNISFFPRGEILGQSGSFVNLKDEDVLFKKNTGLSLSSGCGLSYRLNSKWTAWISPNVKYHLGSMTTEVNVVEQRILRGNLQLGIRIGI